MKYFSRKLLALTMVVTLFTGCSQASATSDVAVTNNTNTNTNTQASAPAVKDEKLKIITTTFAEYDWVRQILGDNFVNFDVTLLLDNGLDLHSYNPSVDDIINIGNADLFIYNGGESTITWSDNVIGQSLNSDLRTLNLIEELGELAQMATHESHEDCTDEECTEDHSHDQDDHEHDEDCTDDECCAEDHDHDHDHDEHEHDEECTDEECCAEEHDHDHDEHEHDEECTDEECTEDHSHDHDDHEHDDCCDEDHDHSHAHEDEHYWLSLNNAKLLCTSIAQQIISIDPSNSDKYTANLESYLEELSALDVKYQDMVDNATRDTFIVADRFPYLYLVNDYNLDYHAAFSGCTAEAEASFETIIYLTEKANELDVSYLVTTETGHEIANTIASSTNSKNQEIVVLDSIQSTTSKSDATYLSIMEENLLVLTEVLK